MGLLNRRALLRGLGAGLVAAGIRLGFTPEPALVEGPRYMWINARYCDPVVLWTERGRHYYFEALRSDRS